ncbi:MAG TPA: YqjK family protein [Sideroxyarcus sp.]|nr:YqjK family protein [Sideroxyarcus sp.]
MKKRLADIACRRRRLLDRIATQRTEISMLSRHWQKPLALADLALNVVHLVRAHPALAAGAVAALLAWRRSGPMALVRSGWRLLFLYPSAVFSGLQYLASMTRRAKP